MGVTTGKAKTKTAKGSAHSRGAVPVKARVKTAARTSTSKVAAGVPAQEGWHGWDDYAPFYDWENARTLGRRDVPFWLRMSGAVQGPVLELGCGTGRVTMPLAHEGVHVVGVDRSGEMLARARRRVVRQRRGVEPDLVRGDIRYLPFPKASFQLVMAPYGVLQSLLSERDLKATLAEVARVVEPDGMLGLELVADLPSWGEHGKRVSMRGRRRAGGAQVTLLESVRQDRTKGLTIFDQEFVERRGTALRRHSFALTFRTLSVPQMTKRLENAGFQVEMLLGDYQGGPWDPRAEVWIIMARKVC
jgi:ubiquinone/menaquinone biosynthesis C-methylase UbiE